MELTVEWEHSQGAEQLEGVEYFEVSDKPEQSGRSLYCEFSDGHAETFHNAVIGAGCV